jgi:transporter family protein
MKVDQMSGNWVIWSLLSALFAGLTAVLAKIGVTDVDSNLATALRTTVVLFFTWGIAFATTPLSVAHLSRRTWVFLTLSGLATGLSWLCYFRALKLGEASRVAPVDKLSVVFVIIFAALFLNERLTVQQLIGATLITFGAIILAWK